MLTSCAYRDRVPQLPRDELVTTAEAAKALGINPRTLAKYARQGLLRPRVVLPSGQLRWNMDELWEQIEQIRRERHQVSDSDRATGEKPRRG